MVEVPGIKGVTVYSAHQPVCTTDYRGICIIPDMLPYQDNSVSVNMTDFSFGTALKTNSRHAVPAWRHGVIARFNPEHTNGITLKAILPDGEVIPSGALAVNSRTNMKSYVAKKGKLFLADVKADDRIMLSWGKGKCRIHLVPESLKNLDRQVLPDIGEMICEPF